MVDYRISPEATGTLDWRWAVEGLEGADPDRLKRLARAYEAKYGVFPPPIRTGVGAHAVRPRVAFAWREADFPTSATRFGFAAG